MEKQSAGIFFNPWKEDFTGDSGRGSLPRIFRKVVWFKANPRSEEYMRALFAEKRPGGSFKVVESAAEAADVVRGAGEIVLLYPDSIGLGFGDFEKRLRKAAGRDLIVLNGRRREFTLDSSMRRSLLLRRFIEKTMLGEAAATLMVAALTPFLMAADLLRGRR